MKKRKSIFLASMVLLLSMSVFQASAAELESGVYYLRNVATGLYLSYGGPWGTHMAAKSRGLDLILNSGEGDGAWRLFSRFDSDGCLGAEGYVDNKVNIDLYISKYYCPLNIHIPIPTLCNTGFWIFCYLRQAPSSVF